MCNVQGRRMSRMDLQSRERKLKNSKVPKTALSLWVGSRRRHQVLAVISLVLLVGGLTTFLGLQWVERAFYNDTRREEYTSLFPARNIPPHNVTTTTSARDRPPSIMPCTFEKSSLRHKIYIYPDYNSSEWQGDILSTAGRDGLSPPWPWLNADSQARQTGAAHYDVNGPFAQYTTELLVRTLLTHPSAACLRTTNPAQATLFFVPYLSSTEFHNANSFVHQVNESASPFGEAIRRILEHREYQAWEDVWGLTSKYWKRRGGADHILVFSEPLQGTFFCSLPRSARFHST